MELGDGAAAAIGCGAKVLDLRTEGRIVRRGGVLPPSVARAVRLRDRDRCRVPGCSRRRYVDVHHIEEQARGGVHSRQNCLCLCTTHHRALHEGRLWMGGDADGVLEVRDADGCLLVEHAVTHSGSSAVLAPSPEAARVLALMGMRGGWTVDALCEASGLSASAVGAVLTTFELEGLVRQDVRGGFGVVH